MYSGASVKLRAMDGKENRFQREQSRGAGEIFPDTHGQARQSLAALHQAQAVPKQETLAKTLKI
jgi:hypothetical protein